MHAILLMFMAAFPMSARAATLGSYDGTFSLDAPRGHVAMDPDKWGKLPLEDQPLLVVQRIPPRPGDLPALFMMRSKGTDAAATARKERGEMVARKDPNFAPTPVEKIRLGPELIAYAFSNGKKDCDGEKDCGYRFVYLSWNKRLLKAACFERERINCLRMLGTIRPERRKSAGHP
ncbi:MAG: hypothetical protein WCU88_11850 [Elusimicrobiota bacterium]